jgi:hypothetical protein
MFVCGTWECCDICCAKPPYDVIMTRPLGRTTYTSGTSGKTLISLGLGVLFVEVEYKMIQNAVSLYYTRAVWS